MDRVAKNVNNVREYKATNLTTRISTKTFNQMCDWVNKFWRNKVVECCSTILIGESIEMTLKGIYI
jgi:hypothetical protein